VEGKGVVTSEVISAFSVFHKRNTVTDSEFWMRSKNFMGSIKTVEDCRINGYENKQRVYRVNLRLLLENFCQSFQLDEPITFSIHEFCIRNEPFSTSPFGFSNER
jgi:hypothetical protein